MFNSRLILGVVLGAAAWLGPASAYATPLFDFRAVSNTTIPQRDTLGYNFTVGAAVSVDGIGIFDFGSDGLGSAHEVALWDGSDPTTPLVTAILNPGTPTVGADPSVSGVGSFLYADIPDLALSPGVNYFIGASFLPANANKDRVVDPAAGGVTANGNATFLGGQLGFSTGVNAEFPGIAIGGDRYFGPNLRIAGTGPPAGIPEPVTLALVILGLAGVGARPRRGAPEARTRPADCAIPT